MSTSAPLVPADTDELRALFEALAALGIAVEITDADGRLQAVTDIWQRLTGYDELEAIGRTPAEILRSQVHPSAFYDEIWHRVTDGQPWRGLLSSRRKDGQLVHVEVALHPIVRDGHLHRFVCLKRDLTAVELLAERDKIIFEAAADAILVTDMDTALHREANPAACVLLERTVDELRQLTGRKLTAPGQDHLVDELSRQLNEVGRASHPSLRLLKGTGREFWAELRMAVFEVAGRRQYVTIIRDVTDRIEREQALARSNKELRAAQGQLVHAGKLAAIGKLAASVVHEINSPAARALLNLTHLLERLETRGEPTNPAETRDLVKEGIQGVEQIAAIVRDLAVFSHADTDHREPTQLNDLVRAAARMTQNQIRHHARLVLDLADLPLVMGSPGRLTQVVTNLLVNAAESIPPESTAPRAITVRTRAGVDSVELEIVDTGCGIPAEHLPLVFEPFFTTRTDRLSSGLGLSLCAEILRQHGGSIALASEVGKGTRAVVRLPRAPSARATPAPPQGRAENTDRRRVLLIDDEPLLLRTYQRLLGSACETVSAAGGRAAIEVLEHDRRFDMILCDLSMPEVDGVAVYDWLSATCPELVSVLVFCTGGALTARSKELLDRGDVRTELKPIDARRLRELAGIP